MNDYKTNKKIYLKNKTKVMLFKADWCIYCKKFEDTWKELQHSKKLKNITFTTYDSDKQQKIFSKYHIESFPTILLQKNNVIQKYEGDRNIQDLTSFILSS